MGEHVTIGVPVYRGEQFVPGALRSIRRQTHTDFDVVISVDGPDPASEAACRAFLDDPRLRLVVQRQRLGWAGNITWLMSQTSGDFWYYHGQDDEVDPTYLEALVAHARRNPDAALVFCDIAYSGRGEGVLEEASVLGATPYLRQLTLLHEHYPAVAFHGLARAVAVRAADGIPTSAFDDMAVDTPWLSAVALHGNLVRLPRPLYRKRYHGSNVSSRTGSWPREKRLQAWAAHCVNMLEQALRVEGNPAEMRLLWFAAVERLTSRLTLGHLIDVEALTPAERRLMLESFIGRARASVMHDIPVLLDDDWDGIVRWTRASFWLPDHSPVTITASGPNPVPRAQPFNPQPDGSSAVWVRTDRRAAPGTRIRLAGSVLETATRGTLLTARVPASLTQHGGPLELVLVAADGRPLSQAALLEVQGPSGAPANRGDGA